MSLEHPDSTAPAVDRRSGAEALYEPLEMAGLTLPNRLVMAPMGTCLDQDGFISDATIAYYRRRAEGGVGTITVEGCLVSQESEGHEPRIHSREYLPGLARLVEQLRPYGVTLGVQLIHPGRQVVEGPCVAPSPVPLNSIAPTPHELSIGEIAAIVADYVRAALLAREAGFDFVEVHGAHGYLPSDFLSPIANRRTDAYGGTLERRARFSLQVAQAIIGACGDALPLVWRINGDDGIPGGFALEEAIVVARMLERAGVAALSVSSGTWHTLHLTLAPMFAPRGQMLGYAAAIKRAVAIPVMAVGRLDDPALASGAIERGEADLIILGRGLIAEPDWPRKVREATVAPRPCIACNACVDLVGRGLPARCSVNPEVGRELSWRIEPAAHPRHVMVVGSGLAGMEAARIARMRGHRVSIWERDAELGGKLEIAGLAPSKREVLRFRDYAAERVRELGVEVHTGVEVTPERVARERPDLVLVATGAEPLVPPIPGIGGANVVDAQQLLSGELPVAAGERIAVVGGSATGCETAEVLAGRGAEVTMLELRGQIGQGIEAITRRHLVRELRERGVRILTRSKVIMIEDDYLLFETAEGRTESVLADRVALALGWRPRGSQLADRLDGVEVVVLGDASSPAGFVDAINAGADAGLAA